jgi:hypothetical protein
LEKIKTWFGRKKSKNEKKYEDEKREFEMAIGNPYILVKVEMPKGFEECRKDFLDLEDNPEFKEEVKDLIKKRLEYKRRGIDSNLDK